MMKRWTIVVTMAALAAPAVAEPPIVYTFDPNAVDRRGFTITRDATGMVLIRGQLDAGNAAPLLAAQCASRAALFWSRP